MILFFVRHGVAEEREEFSKKNLDDRLRPLTDKGKKRFKEMTEWFKDHQDKIDLIISSPYTRAVETAEILQKRFKHEKIEIADWLTPEISAEKSLRELQVLASKRPQLHSVALIGHEPHLGELISHCLTGQILVRLEVKKGSIAAIEINFDQLSPRGKLLWMLNPKLISD